MTKTYVVVDYPAPTVTSPACQACEGRGVTGERYDMDLSGTGPLLVVDVFCPECGGCGSGSDPDHQDCASPHHWNDPFDDFDSHYLDDEETERCPSCQGREWVAVQGFGNTDIGNDEDVTLHYLRVPCGCTTERARLIEEADQ